jgi:anti-sigma-K factor RskA
MAAEHEIWLERGEVYALGALDGQELNEFEAHLASGCSICEAYVRDTCETLTLLPKSLNPVAPSHALKGRILQQIEPADAAPAEEKKSSLSISSSMWNWWGLGIGALATAVVAFVLTSNRNRTKNELQKTKAQLAAAQSESAQKEEQLQLLASPDIRLVDLKGLEAAPSAQAKFFWNPVARSGILLAKGLPKTSTDKAYELWGIAGNEPVPAGVFSVDEQGQAKFQMPALARGKNFDKFAVTVEPAAGVPKPTGPMVLLGSL